MNEEEFKNIFDQAHKLWIEPELTRRRSAGNLPEDFKIYRYLVKLPRDSSPTVEFNDEIGWRAKTKLAPGTILNQPGQAVYVHDIQEIVAVEPPKINEQRVAFIYFLWNGRGYELIFDLTPNLPGRSATKEEDEDWQLGEIIAKSLQAIITEKTIHIHDEVQALLKDIGLWAAPALLPYPLSKIAMQLREGDVSGARSTLLEYCTPDHVASLSTKWWNIEQFNGRKNLIEEALSAHREQRYGLSIHALLPQVEGIITEWVYSNLSASETHPWRPESKAKRFRDLILDGPPTTFTYKRIVESTIDFIIGGPVLETFKRWTDEINKAFPNRHVVGHGKYEESLYTEENSIKLILLLDTLYHIVSAQLEGSAG